MLGIHNRYKLYQIVIYLKLLFKKLVNFIRLNYQQEFKRKLWFNKYLIKKILKVINKLLLILRIIWSSIKIYKGYWLVSWIIWSYGYIKILIIKNKLLNFAIMTSIISISSSEISATLKNKQFSSISITSVTITSLTILQTS
jgi:hypothetical protein